MISFIIPTLNEEKVIEKILQNLSLYSGKKEIIVSDGKSSDMTVEIARKYTDHVVVYDGTQRQTIAGGRNMGAEMARGRYLVFLDADMSIPDPDTFFLKAKGLFDEHNLVGLAVGIRVFSESETFGDKIVFSTMDIVHFFFNNILKKGVSTGEFQMVSVEAFKKINGYNEQLAVAEDHDFFRKISKVGRTHFERTLRVYHTGRRAHKIGWPKLLYLWSINGLHVLFLKRSKSKEWTVIR